MGSLVVPVRQLLSKPQLVQDEWMPLDGALPDSEILLRAELKVRDRPLSPLVWITSMSDTLRMFTDPELDDDWSSTASYDQFKERRGGVFPWPAF